MGPALLVSCAIAGKKPGSKVIICTDGMSSSVVFLSIYHCCFSYLFCFFNTLLGLANIGLGSLDTDSKEKAISFYSELATYAKSVGVTVSVITIAGNVTSLPSPPLLSPLPRK